MATLGSLQKSRARSRSTLRDLGGTEAGGSFTDWNGTPTHTAPEALATNGKLLDAVLEKLG